MPASQDAIETLMSNLSRLAVRVDPHHQRLLDRINGPRPANPDPGWAWPGIYLGVGNGGHVWSGPEHHVLVIGPPRAGKTTSIVMPTLNYHLGPAVVTSTKDDVIRATAPYRQRTGRCWLWDPTGTIPRPDGVGQLRWSPTQGCETWDNAVARAWALATAARPAQHLTEASHWVERAQALLAPLLHAAALADGDLAVVLSWLHRRELAMPLAILEQHQARLAQDLLTGIAITDHREQSGIFSTADSILAAYRTTAGLAATRNPNFDAEQFVRSADTLYLCSPGSAHHQHAPLVVALLHHLRDAINTRPQPWPSVIWALDELANIAPLPDLPNIVADSAAQGLLILGCLQDLSQARQQWGAAADGLLTLFPTNVILPGVADLTTLKAISAIAGEWDITRTSHSRPRSRLQPHHGGPTVSTHQETRPRLPVHEIAQGKRGHALLLTSGSPAWLQLSPWQAGVDSPTLSTPFHTAPESGESGDTSVQATLG